MNAMMPVTKKAAARFEKLGVPVDRISPEGPHVPYWATLAGDLAGDYAIRLAVASPALQEKLVELRVKYRKEQSMALAVASSTQVDRDRIALMTRAFPKHPYLVLRALRHARNSGWFSGVGLLYSSLLFHASIGMECVPDKWHRQPGENATDFEQRHFALLRAAAVHLKGLPVDVSRP